MHHSGKGAALAHLAGARLAEQAPCESGAFLQQFVEDSSQILGGGPFAILVSVPPPFLPAGLLVLDGVPLVVHRFRPVRPLPGNADVLWPREPAIPSYPV